MTVAAQVSLKRMEWSGDILTAARVTNCPETTEFPARMGIEVEPVEARFRGFDAPSRVWRARMTAEVGNSGGGP